MKTFKALYIDNGIIKANEFPEAPDMADYSVDEYDVEDYQQALASAKANAVVVEDQDKAMSFSWYGRVPESKIIPLPSGWDYRVVKRCTNCERLGCESISCRDPYDGSMSYTQVAILYRTVEQSEPEESQEDLMYELFRPAYKASDTGEYFRRGHHTSGRKINRDQFYRLLKLIKDNLQENFILTRKP